MSLRCGQDSVVPNAALRCGQPTTDTPAPIGATFERETELRGYTMKLWYDDITEADEPDLVRCPKCGHWCYGFCAWNHPIIEVREATP